MVNRFKSSNSVILTLSAVIFLFGIAPVAADTVDVSIPAFSFDPAVLTVNIGTTVRWTNNHNINHTSTSDNSLWDSGTLMSGQSFLYTFESIGEFPYHCTFHPSMTATVTVNQARPVPSLGIFGIIFLALTIITMAIWINRKKASPANL